MKKTLALIVCLCFGTAFSQDVIEKEVKSEVNEVIVFIEGAQVVRKKDISLAKGITTLKFVNLSPFIDAKSIQVKAEGDIMVLSVNHQQNYLEKLEKPRELTTLESRLNALDEKIRLENAYLSILKEELSFLQENKVIGGKNQELSVSTLKEASSFYSTRMTTLKLKEIELEKNIKELARQKRETENQISTLTSKKEFASGEILVKVDAKKDMKSRFEISYMVGNAGWFPSYDIRANNINEPVELIYKANVRQDTKVDWKNVKLKFSSSEPNISGVAPILKTYYLNYNTIPPVYNRQTNRVSGRVVDTRHEALPGANVTVQGTTIGAITDVSGNYTITIPDNAANLVFSYIGFQTKILPISGPVMNVVLDEDMVQLQEVVVVGYGIDKKGASQMLPGAVPGVSVEKKDVRVRGVSSLTIPSVQVEKQTTVEFEIDLPFTVNSDNKSYAVDMIVYNLPALYQYYCVPKIDRGAFLIANIVDWEKYSLLEGEANVFFEDTYVGKTLLDVRYAVDTLQISLGRDKNISVNREKLRDFTTRQFIGNRKEETRSWKTTIRNNKGQVINMLVLDQVPVSTNPEIEINAQRTANAKHNTETGEIKWEFTLAPGESKDFELRYSVKYPKNRALVIE